MERRFRPIAWFTAFARRRPIAAPFLALVALLLFGGGLYAMYVGASPVIYRDGLFYFSMREDAPWLPRSVRVALNEPNLDAQAGEVTWRRLDEGLEIGQVPVLVDGEEVDRVYLTRIDPRLYEFRLRVDPDNDLDAWMRELQPVAVINGSYYDAQFGPATPVRIDGQLAGPSEYDATHGAFVWSEDAARIVDLANVSWRDVIEGWETAMVSYPTLVDATGQNRAPQSRWLASRSFVAEDQDGMILLGSAPEGFFSLYRLGEFLRLAPLRLRYVLNLDGGPVACHGVSAGGVTRLLYGHVELQSDGEGAPLRVLPASRNIHALMPIVLAVFPRAAPEPEAAPSR